MSTPQEHDPADKWYVPIFQDGRRLSYKKGEIILRPHDIPQGVYVLLSGLIKTYFIDNAGSEHVHHFIVPHELFPLSWAALGEHLNIYYEAISDVEVSRIPREVITKQALSNTNTAYLLFQHSATQYSTFVEYLHCLELKYAQERIAARLLLLIKRLGFESSLDPITLPHITQKDLAASINLTPESTSRELNIFRRKGVIDFTPKKHQIIVKNIDALKNQIKDTMMTSLTK